MCVSRADDADGAVWKDIANSNDYFLLRYEDWQSSRIDIASYKYVIAINLED